MSLFEQWILQEAVPKKAKQLGISPETPPDLTNPNVANSQDNTPPPTEANPNAGNQNEPADVDPNAIDDPTADNPDPEIAGGGGESGGDPTADNPDPEIAGDGGEGGGEEGDPTADNPDPEIAGDGGDLQGPGDVGDEIKQSEDEVYKDLKPEQKAVRDKELKERYQDFYKIVSESLDKLNKVTKTSYDATIIDLALRQLLSIKDMVYIGITKLFTNRSYGENKIELQKLVTEFNLIINSISNIYEARVKRAEKYSKSVNQNNLDQIDFTQDLGW